MRLLTQFADHLMRNTDLMHVFRSLSHHSGGWCVANCAWSALDTMRLSFLQAAGQCTKNKRTLDANSVQRVPGRILSRAELPFSFPCLPRDVT